MNYKDRIERSQPVFSEMVKNQAMSKLTAVAGAAAGNVSIAGIKVGDRLTGVVDIAGVDLLSEFSIVSDGVINNTGGTSSAASVLIVSYEQWEQR